MSSQVKKNNIIPEKVLQRFLKGKGEKVKKVKNRSHGSWYYNGLAPSLKPISKRFNVMLALRGDPDYKPSDPELLRLAKGMYPDDPRKQKIIFQRMKILNDENRQKRRLKDYKTRMEAYNKANKTQNWPGKDIGKPMPSRPRGIMPEDKGLMHLDANYNVADGYDPMVYLLDYDPAGDNPSMIAMRATNESYPFDNNIVMRTKQDQDYIPARNRTYKDIAKNKDIYRELQKMVENGDDDDVILQPRNVDYFTRIANNNEEMNRLTVPSTQQNPFTFDNNALKDSRRFFTGRLRDKESDFSKKIKRLRLSQREFEDFVERRKELEEDIDLYHHMKLRQFIHLLHSSALTKPNRIKLQEKFRNYCDHYDIDPKLLDQREGEDIPHGDNNNNDNGGNNHDNDDGDDGDDDNTDDTDNSDNSGNDGGGDAATSLVDAQRPEDVRIDDDVNNVVNNLVDRVVDNVGNVNNNNNNNNNNNINPPQLGFRERKQQLINFFDNDVGKTLIEVITELHDPNLTPDDRQLMANYFRQSCEQFNLDPETIDLRFKDLEINNNYNVDNIFDDLDDNVDINTTNDNTNTFQSTLDTGLQLGLNTGVQSGLTFDNINGAVFHTDPADLVNSITGRPPTIAQVTGEMRTQAEAQQAQTPQALPTAAPQKIYDKQVLQQLKQKADEFHRIIEEREQRNAWQALREASRALNNHINQMANQQQQQQQPTAPTAPAPAPTPAAEAAPAAEAPQAQLPTAAAPTAPLVPRNFATGVIQNLYRRLKQRGHFGGNEEQNHQEENEQMDEEPTHEEEEEQGEEEEEEEQAEEEEEEVEEEHSPNQHTPTPPPPARRLNDIKKSYIPKLNISDFDTWQLKELIKIPPNEKIPFKLLPPKITSLLWSEKFLTRGPNIRNGKRAFYIVKPDDEIEPLLTEESKRWFNSVKEEARKVGREYMEQQNKEQTERQQREQQENEAAKTLTPQEEQQARRTFINELEKFNNRQHMTDSRVAQVAPIDVLKKCYELSELDIYQGAIEYRETCIESGGGELIKKVTDLKKLSPYEVKKYLLPNIKKYKWQPNTIKRNTAKNTCNDALYTQMLEQYNLYKKDIIDKKLKELRAKRRNNNNNHHGIDPNYHRYHYVSYRYAKKNK